jgi:hypothetical protein
VAAAAFIAPAPASASTYIYCYLQIPPYPRMSADGTLASTDAYVACVGGAADSINVTLDLSRDGTRVASTAMVGRLYASGSISTSCVPGNYVATAYGSVLYPFGNIPSSDSIWWQSPAVYISCVSAPVVASPGNQTNFVYDSVAVQMSATGGTRPYTWSATGLPTGVSINSSTGLISGFVTRIATATVVVTATDAAGSSGRTQFTWRVRGEPCPRC